MPAKSAAQQKDAGAALSARRGGTAKFELELSSKSLAGTMNRKQLADLAHTTRQDKPEPAARD